MNIRTLSREEYPPFLKEIPDPPKSLYVRGVLPKGDTPHLAVVGSRNYTAYGKDACEHIIHGLRGSGIVIVSGLALGIDAIAHRSALDAGLLTVAIPGSGLHPSVLYPRTHNALAEKILSAGGALLSEFEPAFRATPYAFPQRNRLMAGMSRGVLVIEAGEKSGTLITARLALEYNRDVFVVPGSIFSRNTSGAHWLLKQGAIPATSADDILEQWNIKKSLETQYGDFDPHNHCSSEERRVIELLKEPVTKDALMNKAHVSAQELNILLSSLEMKGIIKESMGEIYLIV